MISSNRCCKHLWVNPFFSFYICNWKRKFPIKSHCSWFVSSGFVCARAQREAPVHSRAPHTGGPEPAGRALLPAVWTWTQGHADAEGVQLAESQQQRRQCQLQEKGNWEGGLIHDNETQLRTVGLSEETSLLLTDGACDSVGCWKQNGGCVLPILPIGWCC